MISLLLSNMCIQNPRNPAKCRENRACEATTNRCYCRYYCCLSVTSQSYFPFPRFLKSFGSKSARVQLQNIERSDVCSGEKSCADHPDSLFRFSNKIKGKLISCLSPLVCLFVSLQDAMYSSEGILFDWHVRPYLHAPHSIVSG